MLARSSLLVGQVGRGARKMNAGRDSSLRPARAVVGERSLQALPGRLFTHAATPVPASGKDM